MMSTFYFKYKRVVLIDSADLCYAEIPLDEHAILLGGGNVGKSSILNSLRLFLLPEVNFAKCESKFSFRSRDKDQYYSKDDSFQHYFPSSNSFLILEVENFIGSYCQILYREKGYQYRRIFVPLTYDRIRDIFWSCCESNDGIGEAIEGLSVSSVLKQLKERAATTLVVSDTEKLKQLLYANNLLNNSETRYSLFPLIEHDDSKIESLRALFMLLFDINASSQMLSKAIANIIEADKKSSQDVLNFNIHEFIQRHEELKQEGDQLTFIKNKKSNFEKLENRFKKYTQLSDTDKKYAHFLIALERYKKKTIDEKQIVDNELSPLEEKIKEEDSKLKEKSNALFIKKAEYKVKEKDLEEAQSSFENSTQVWKGYYPSSTIEEARDTAKFEYETCLEELTTLTSEVESNTRRQELEGEIKKLNITLKKLEESSENQQFLLINQLGDSTSEVLAAINKKLILANPKRELRKEELDAIRSFTTLFNDNNDEYQWFDHFFTKQSATVTEDLQQQYDDSNRKLEKYNVELAKLKQPSDSFHRQKDITELETKRDDLKSKFDSLKQYPVAETNIQKYKNQLQKTLIDKNNLAAEETIIETELNKKKQKYSELKPKQERTSKQLEKIIMIEKTCKRLEREYPRLEKAIKVTSKQSHSTFINVTETELEDIEASLRGYQNLRNKIISSLQNFIYENIIDDEDHIQVDSPTSKSIRKTFKRLQEVFDEFPQKRKILEEQVNTHNQSVSHYTNVLTKHFEHIDLFRSQLNREFENITINNLEKVEVHIDIDRRFKSLIAEINKADFHSDQFLSNGFYERLKVFVNSFFIDSNDYKLTMDKVITGLHYKIKKQGNKNWQDKLQSNSTTALINMELAQILLNRIKKAGCDVIFPLVHDEVAEINIDQFDWLLSHLTQKGFRLFSAATFSTSPDLIHKIGNYHEIGNMKTARSYNPDRRSVYWGGAETFQSEKGLDKTSLAHSEQSQLFPSGNE